MSSRRLLKAAEAIREVVSLAILTELRDPRIRDVTVIGVEVAPDMRSAKISVSIMGPESKQQLALRGLDNAKGFLQSRIADRIDTRYTPKLQFVVDQGVKKSLEVGKILEQLAAERQASEQGKSLGPDSLTDSDSIPDNERPESHRSEDELSDEAEIEIEEDSEES